MKVPAKLPPFRMSWVLVLLVLSPAMFHRLRTLGDEVGQAWRSGGGPDASQALLQELDAIRPKLPPRGRISLLLQGESLARELRPIIDILAPAIVKHYQDGGLPADTAMAAVVKAQADGLRSRFPGISQGHVPDKEEIADLLEKIGFATLDAGTHTIAQYALAPLIIDPVLRPGLILARLPAGKARAEALRMGLRWKKAVGDGWYLLEKRP